MERTPAPPPGDITRLLHEWRDGDGAAPEQLFELVYRELKAIAARRIAGSGLQRVDSTEIVNEAMLRLLGNVPSLNDRSHFFKVAATAIRYTLVDLARRQHADKRGAGVEPLTLSMADQAGTGDADWLDVERALEALERQDARKCRIVELAFLVGLNQQEIAQALGLSLSTVERDLRFARAWLRDRLER